MQVLKVQDFMFAVVSDEDCGGIEVSYIIGHSSNNKCNAMWIKKHEASSSNYKCNAMYIKKHGGSSSKLLKYLCERDIIVECRGKSGGEFTFGAKSIYNLFFLL